MIGHSRPNLARWRKLPVWLKVAAGIAAVMVAIPVLGIVFQMIATDADHRTYPPSGALVDMGGWQMHLVCEGEASQGKPTVIFESALGANSLAWSKAMPLVARHTRACAYDRAGYGWSDPSPNPRDGQQIARELHALLDAAGEKPPYILVGYSLGGLLVRVHRDVYPEDVAALVLVDARHHDFFTRMPPDYLEVDEQNRQRSLMMEQITPFGLSRVAGAFGLLDAGTTNIIQPLPPSMQDAAWAVMIHNPRHWQTANAERALNDLTYGQARQAAPLGDLPLIVLSAEDGLDRWTPPSGAISQRARTAWNAMQAELAALSNNSRHVIVKSGGHYFHLEQPESVEDAILSLLDLR